MKKCCLTEKKLLPSTALKFESANRLDFFEIPGFTSEDIRETNRSGSFSDSVVFL